MGVGVGSGGLCGLVEAWGHGKEVTGGWCKCVPMYAKVRSGVGWQGGQSLALILLPHSFFFFHPVNKQLADKERVAAALENTHLLEVVNQCLSAHS